MTSNIDSTGVARYPVGTCPVLDPATGAALIANPVTVRGVIALFARNQRVVCVFDSEHGPFVLVLVGATIVGSTATAWHGVMNPPRPRQLRVWRFDWPADILINNRLAICKEILYTHIHD